MANSQIMVTVGFQADTTQAKAKMQELQNQLKSLQSLNSIDLPLGKTVSDLEKAKNAAAQLQVQLQTAFNQDTGKLDLTRFNQSLKQSNMSLQQYKNILLQAGPVGQQAFGQLAVQIASADTHVIRINQHLAKLGVTLANTFRWQISSAALMGVTSTISEAYSFAQDLNESLNEIRIVTGNSANQMARFAKEANNAAKALSTTTTKYTDASLIYFQQGLNEKQVKERTDLTIKMANVTGQSVSEVSDQLTAVWNNFDNGTQSLEYYVDVMVALGAATASSSEEISEGLNKFAAVAETVGLSYEYAASALATVTATTRQSADVVGTAFKTLFARIQDLELGETLDDGTTLGKYSQALASVGINIKDVNGQVKDMNLILDEMGSKWNTLTKDQQIALAQNVAGVRQYTQLIALMDNWSYFQENLNTAYTSSGELQKQSDIYAEGWEAARDRVTAALEDIYQDILVDDTFIAILDFFGNLLENIDNVIESVGGLNGVLTILAAVLMKVYQNSIATSLSSMGATMMGWTKAGQAKINQTRTEAYNEATTIYDESNASGRLGNENIRNQINTETRYNELTANATEQQKAILNIRKESIQKQNEENEKLIEELRTLEQITAELNEQASSTPYKKSEALYLQSPGNVQQASWESLETISKQSGASQIFGKDLQLELYDDRMGSYLSGDYSDKSLNKASDATSEIVTKMESLRFGADGAEKELKELFGEDVYNALEKYYQKLKETQQIISSLQKDPKARENAKIEQDSYISKKSRMDSLGKTQGGKKTPEYKQLEKEVTAYKEKQEQLLNTSNEVDKTIGKTNEQLDKQTNAMIKARGSTEEAENEVRNFVSGNQQLTQKTTEASVAIGKTKKDVDQLNATLSNSMGPVTFSQKLTTFASMAMSASMALQGFKSLIDTWNNEDISFGDKLIQSMMSIGMILPALTTLMNKQNVARLFGVNAMKLENGQWIFNTQQKGANTVATWLQKIAQDALNGSIGATIAMFAIALVAIGAIIGIIYLLVNAQEKEKTALEKATEAAKNQREALESITEATKEMTTALEEAKELISSYSEVSNAFDGLVKGSDAYNENLQKEIELVNQLLEKYPELMDMGIIGQGARGLQVLDEAALQQYLVGTATVNMLNMQIAQKYAAEDLEINDAIVESEKKLEEFNNEVAKQTPIIAQANDDGQKIVVSDGAGNSWEVNTGFRDEYAKESADIRASYVDEQFNYWKEQLALGKTLQEIKGTLWEEYQQNLFSVFEDYLDVQDGYNEQLKLINDEHAKKLEEINKKYEAQYLALANQILSYQKGFSQLNQFQQSATTALVSQQLQKNSKTYEFQSGYGVEFSKELGDYILEATGVQGKKWSERNGTTDENGNLLNDIGDFFVNTPEGLEAAAKYLQTQGYSDITADKLKNSYNLDTKGITSKEDSPHDIDIDWSEIAGYFQGEAIYEGINYEEFMQDSKSRSDATNAAIAKNLSLLSEEQISRIATGSREEGFKLKETSADIQEAAKILQLEGDAYDNWIATLTEQVEHYDAALAETLLLQQDMEKGNSLIAGSSEKYDLDAEVVENYAKSLYNANKAQGMSYESAAKLAIANGRLSKGIDTLRDKWSDISQILNTTSKNSYEWMEAATEASKALEEMFGVAVSTDFIDTYSDKITTLVNGGDEAVKVFQELELLAGKDYVMSLNLDEEYKTQFTSMLEELTSQEYEGITVGIKGEIDQSYIDSMNKLLKEGAITVDEVNAMFNSIGWDPNITTKEGDPVETVQEQHIVTADDKNYTKNKEESWQKIVTTTIPQVPVIGNVTSAPKSTSSVKTNTTSGSSKSKTKSKDTEIDRYHEQEKALESLERQLNRISSAKDRAFGPKRAAYAKQEQEFLEQQIEAQKDLIAEAERYLALDRDALMKYGASIDERGNISNYDEIYQAQIDAYNAIVASGNETAISNAEEQYEKFKTAISNYEESLQKVEDETTGLMDLQAEKLEKALEDIQTALEENIEIADANIQLLEHQIENLTDSIYDAADALVKLGEVTSQTQTKNEFYLSAIRETLAAAGMTSEQVEAAISSGALPEGFDLNVATIEQLRSLQDELYSQNESLKDQAEQVQEKMREAADSMNEKLEEQGEKIQHNASIMESYKNIIDLVGQDFLGISDDFMRQMGQTQVVAANNALTVAKNTLEMNQAILNQTQAEYDALVDSEELSEEDQNRWKETLKEREQAVRESQENVMSLWEEALQAATDAYEAEVERVCKIFEDAMAGVAGSAEAMETQFSQRKEISELYVKDYQKIYELSKLTRDITNSMDSMDSLRGKERLAEIQKEINKLQESGVKMTQYEVDELRAKYELRLAEIALEEAQNAKSQVRMQRDASGNWGYVYTADQDAIDNAQKNYEDKLYAYQELTDNYILEMQEKFMALPAAFTEAMQNIRREDYTSEEEYQAAIDAVRQHYTTLATYYTDQVNTAIGNSKDFYEQDWMSYSEKTGYKISKNGEWITSFDQTILAQVTGYATAETALATFTSNTEVLIESLSQAYQIWQENVADSMDLAGTSITEFKDKAAEENEKIRKDNEDTAKSAKEMADAYKNEYSEIIEAATEWARQYSIETQDIIDQNINIINSLNNMISAYQKFANTEVPNIVNSYKEIEQAAKAAIDAQGGVNDDLEDDTYKDDEIIYSPDPITVISTNGTSFEVTQEEALTMTKPNYGLATIMDGNVKRLIREKTYYKILEHFNPTDKKQFLSNGAMVSMFDTGGYTGDWDSSGRLAVLHQKEIVLNQEDTKNFLSAIEVLRAITRTIDLQAAAQSNSLGAMMRATTVQANGQTVQQDITIHAEFPNATNHSEIEEAFDTLFTRASQFANRKN